MRRYRHTSDRRQRQAGFTIIESLIVLSVAGLILLVILLAIPALQRNSRNNQRRQDVQGILSAVSQWQLNHAGNIPASSENYLQAGKVKLSAYDDQPGVITIHGGSPGSPASVPPANSVAGLSRVNVYNYQRCNTATAGGSTSQGAGYSDIVALYTIEQRTGAAGKCQQL